VEVRVLGPGDLAELDAAIPTGRNDVHAAFLGRDDVVYLGAWVDGVVVGTAVLRAGGELGNLHVAEAARGRGAGTALIRLAEQVARERGQTQVTIAVAEDNPRAAALYQRLGYADTGGRRTDSYTYFDADGGRHHATEHSRILVTAV
jgi:ribosomal protein S18 acetylase RimI-like enzyme